MVGAKIERLTVLREYQDKYKMALCRCDCGAEVKVILANLKRGNTKSCGCLNSEMVSNRNRTHGYKHCPEYNAYMAAKGRCTNTKGQDYARYGGRGIKFLFESFESFIKEVGLKPSPAHSLDREDNDGNYAHGNVRWATAKEQAKNRGYLIPTEEQNYALLVAYAQAVMSA